MFTGRKGHYTTSEETANLLEEIAGRLRDGERSFELQLPISQAQTMMLEMNHMDGLRLLNRISLLLLTKNKKNNVGHDFTRKRLEALSPLDPLEDSKTLQILADQIRGNGRSFSTDH